MPLTKLVFRPGVNRDQTNYAGEGGYYECDKIRFFSGFPQKLGGWLAYADFVIKGIARQLWTWITTYEDNLLAIGTNSKVYIEAGTLFYDITPLRVTYTNTTVPSTANCFDTTSGSNLINVNITSHGAAQGDYVIFSGVTAFAGGFLPQQFNAEFVVEEVVDANNFTVQVAPVSNRSYSVTSTTATITSASHGLTNGDIIVIAFVAETGTAPPEDIYSVTVVDTDTFEVTVASGSGAGLASFGLRATSTVSNTGGTSIVAKFQISPGNPYLAAGYGWGTSDWGGSNPSTGWGLGSTQPFFLPQRDWWFDNFDNDLVMNIRNGPIYYWERGATSDPLIPLSNPAKLLSSLPGASNVPQQAMQVLVSQNDKHLIAFGATPFGGGAFDALLIRWASQEDPVNWTPSPTNSAGFLRVSRGSRIVRALATRQEILVWTESHLYSFQFLGTSDVFGLQEYADNISIISPRCCITVDNVTYWMGKDKFYTYTGRVETLPTTLRNHVFNNINFNQSDQIVCGSNEGFNEIWWMYPSATSTVNDSYVIYNYLERVWYYGTIQRTAWLDSPIREYPMAVQSYSDTLTSKLLSHEDGLNDDTLPMNSFIQTNDFDLDEGDRFVLTRRILPDISFAGSTNQNPQVTFSVSTRNYPGQALNSNAQNAKPVLQTQVDQFTNQVFVRARARQMSLKVESNDLDSKWQLGASRLDGRPDGER